MSSNNRNFLVDLHEPAREILLCSLDAGTLTACCCVCKSWNVIVNSCKEAWKNACIKLGLIFEEDEFSEASYLKSYALSIIERKIRMRKSTCFSAGRFSIHSNDIKAICCQNGRIAVAFSDKIQIWKYKTNTWELNYGGINFEAVRLMLLGNILLIGTMAGEIRALRVSTAEEVRLYRSEYSSLTSFDCLLDLNIIAGSYSDSCISIWNFLTAQRVKFIYHKNFMIVKIMLTPRIPEEASQKKQVFLFSVDIETICLRIVTFDPVDMTDVNVEVRLCSMIPLDIPPRMPKTFTFIGSLLFDGKFLYYPKLSPREHGNTIGVWDVYKEEAFKEINMLDEVKGLLAIGKKYMAIHTKDRNGGGEKLCITKKLSNTEVGFCKLPRDVKRLGTFDNHFLTIGETSWLDGLDGFNDRGLLYAYIVDNVGLLTQTWSQRIIKVF